MYETAIVELRFSMQLIWRHGISEKLRTPEENVLPTDDNCDVIRDAYVNNMNLYNIAFISQLCSKVAVSPVKYMGYF